MGCHCSSSAQVDLVQLEIKPAVSKELCERVRRCVSFCCTLLPYLSNHQQVQLQGLDRWSYEEVARAQQNFELGQTLYFPWGFATEMLQVRERLSTTTVASVNGEIENYQWVSINLGKNLFQRHKNGKCRLLQNTGPAKFRVVDKAIASGRVNTSYANLQNRFIFCTGGFQLQGMTWLTSVERYSISRDVWEEMPSMVERRNCHGSCILGSILYAICGYQGGAAGGIGGGSKYLNSVEKLDTRENRKTGWELVPLPNQSLLTPLMDPVISALNSNEILILGGEYDYQKYNPDAFVLNTDTRIVKKVEMASPVALMSLRQSYQVQPGVVVAFVDSKEVDSNGDPIGQSLIEYRDGEVNVLMNNHMLPKDASV